jgi:hypothetical protein
MGRDSRTANRIKHWAERLGYDVYVHEAQTGTLYLKCSGEAATLRIRVADHADAYCRADISVSPADCTWWQAVKKLALANNQPVPAAVRRAELADLKRRGFSSDEEEFWTVFWRKRRAILEGAYVGDEHKWRRIIEAVVF